MLYTQYNKILFGNEEWMRLENTVLSKRSQTKKIL